MADLEVNLQDFFQKLPVYVTFAAKTLQENGFKAYLVGGSVRDIFLKRIPGDYDIATDAYPDDLIEIFPKAIPTGAKFGTIVVVLPDEEGENHDIEITTFRSEADYFAGRWPAKVEFTKTIEEDLARRDFTINAMAVNLQQEKAELVDLYGGVVDLQARMIRAVGDPLERFTEDGLRSLRACRLAANLEFTIEPATFAAISDVLSVIDNLSKERIRDEFIKLLMKSPRPSIGLEYLRQSGILKLIIPELLESIGVNQPQFHIDDVYTHSLKCVDLAEDNIKLAALFHDIGKARTRSEDTSGVHFYGHDVIGADMTKQIMRRLRFSNSEIEHTYRLVRWHMFYYPNSDWRKNLKSTQVEDQSTLELKTELLVMRHAQNELSVDNKIAGTMTDHLTDLGKQQAKDFANNLDEKYDFILTSQLARANETAEIIAQILNIPIYIDSRFNERNFGELQGLTWQEFVGKYPELANYPGNSEHRQEHLPSGESIPVVESRVRVGLFNLVKSHLGKRIILITHNGVIRIIQRTLNPELKNHPEQVIDPDHCQTLNYSVKLADIDPQFLSDQELECISQEQIEAGGVIGGWSDAAVRRFIRNVGGDDIIDDLMKLRIADAAANPKAVYNPKEVMVLAERIAKVREQDMALKVTDLDVSGDDMMNLGFKGVEIRDVLNHLLDQVVEDPILNDKETLLKLAREYQQKSKTV